MTPKPSVDRFTTRYQCTMAWWSVLVAACFLMQPRITLAVTPTEHASTDGDGTLRATVHDVPLSGAQFSAAAVTRDDSGFREPTDSSAPPRLAAYEQPSAAVFRNRIVYGGRLYRGREFSTFRRNLMPAATRPTETAYRTLPLDQRIEDRWFAVDKAKHVAFSFLWTLSTQYVAVNKGDLSEHRALPISVTTSAVIGVGKEYYDLHSPSGVFSRRDLVANAFGILLGAGVILL